MIFILCIGHVLSLIISFSSKKKKDNNNIIIFITVIYIDIGFNRYPDVCAYSQLLNIDQ